MSRIKAYTQAVVIPGEEEGELVLRERVDGDGLIVTVTGVRGGASVTLDVWGAATLIGRYHEGLDTGMTYQLKLEFPP